MLSERMSRLSSPDGFFRNGNAQRIRGSRFAMNLGPEEVELADFLDGLGPYGISKVSLYRHEIL